MKQAQSKSFLILVLLAILSLFLVMAVQDIPDNTDATLTSPADNTYYLDDRPTFTCNGSAVLDWNITSITLYTTVNGTSGSNWNESSNSSAFNPPINNNTAFGIQPIILVPDGTNLIWNCRVNYTNMTSGVSSAGINVTSVFADNNRTLKVEYRPTITLKAPSDGYWTNATSETINFSVSSVHTSNTGFDCYIYQNTSTSNWTSSTYVRGLNKTTDRAGITNTSDTTFTHLFEEGRYKWGIWCAEGADNNIFNFSNSNFTINVDRTAPVITLTYIENNTATNNLISNKNDLSINYSLVETNPLNVTVFINGSGNVTDTGYSGKNNFTIPDIADGVYSLLIQATDITNVSSNSTSYLFTLDTNYPNIINVQNGTPSGFADRWTINFTSDESVNYTIYYGTTTAVTSSTSSATKTNDTEVTLKSLAENTKYYFNITVCDIAGNCNMSVATDKQNDFTFPFKLLTGWSYYGVFDAKINFSRVLTQTEADYVYYWNQTKQEWVYATSGGTSNMGFEVGTSVGSGIARARHVVALYEGINSTWDRNTTNSGYYHFNLTSGDNFIKLPTDYTFGNLSRSFLNMSYQEGGIAGYEYGFGPLTQTPGNVSQTAGDDSAGGLEYNLTAFYYSAYNNSATTWSIDYIYNWSWNNNSPVLKPISISEIVWIFSPTNLTWNGTNIYANWTI